MNFKIINVKYYASPAGLNVDEILNTYGTSLADMKKAMMDAVFVHRSNLPVTKDLAKQLEDLLERLFTSKETSLYPFGYSPTRRMKADVEVGPKGCPKRIFIEIEFRPDGEYKDIVKFLIGHKKQTLELGILIAVMNEETMKAINPKYHPIYEKVIQTIEELQSDCPILVIGFDGQMISNEGIET